MLYNGIILTTNSNLNSEIDSSITLETSGSATLCYGDWALISSTLQEPKNVTWYVKSENEAVGMTVLFMTWTEYIKFENTNPYTVTSILADGSQHEATGTFLEENGTTWAFVFMHNDSSATLICPQVTYRISFERGTIPGFEFAPLLLSLFAAAFLLHLGMKKQWNPLKPI